MSASAAMRGSYTYAFKSFVAKAMLTKYKLYLVHPHFDLGAKQFAVFLVYALPDNGDEWSPYPHQIPRITLAARWKAEVSGSATIPQISGIGCGAGDYSVG